ncbi:hypothetical protein [Curtobacterium sp. NPDC089991]|uniref:hypothetical protein n=1 Tax=Curtobacterium sp. NPDC089991 TaxID=3363969 RepID=UPI003828E0D2
MDSPLNTSQRFLATAYDSVANLIEKVYPAVKGAPRRGRLTDPEQDVFRSAVVFAGAGVDTTLKQALRDAAPLQASFSKEGRAQFQRWVTGYIQQSNAVDAKKVSALLIAEPNPARELQRLYIEQLTDHSLQSQDQVKATLVALGLEGSKALFRDSSVVNPLFKARNEIAHAMDMTDHAARGVGDRTRNDRKIETYVNICHAGLDYCQRVLNALQTSLDDNPEIIW